MHALFASECARKCVLVVVVHYKPFQIDPIATSEVEVSDQMHDG